MKQINFSNKSYTSLCCSYDSLSTRYKRVTLRFVVGRAGLVSGTFTVKR